MFNGCLPLEWSIAVALSGQLEAGRPRDLCWPEWIKLPAITSKCSCCGSRYHSNYTLVWGTNLKREQMIFKFSTECQNRWWEAEWGVGWRGVANSDSQSGKPEIATVRSGCHWRRLHVCDNLCLHIMSLWAYSYWQLMSVINRSSTPLVGSLTYAGNSLIGRLPSASVIMEEDNFTQNNGSGM